jgi:hypothetical protein
MPQRQRSSFHPVHRRRQLLGGRFGSCLKRGALALLAALLCGAATAQITAIKQTQQPAISGTLQTPSIDGLLALRDDAFERRRKELFADARFMADLRTQPASSDSAAQFAARVLARWAADAPPAYAALEHFITVEEPQLRATNRSAAGGGGTTALLKHLAQYQDLPEVLDYLVGPAKFIPTPRQRLARADTAAT